MRSLSRPWAHLAVAALAALGSSACAAPAEPDPADATETFATEPTDFRGSDLVLRSIAFHDPDGLWGRVPVRAQLELERPDRPLSGFDVEWDPARSAWTFRSRTAEQTLAWHLESDADGGWAFTGTLDGREVTDSAEAESLQLTRERAELWRDYHGYLLGLPMRLTDPGAEIADTVASEVFEGRTVYVVRVSYREPVGSDTWDFFLDPETYALLGCRFFHAQPSDGETLVFSERIEAGSLQLPALRRWYVTATNALLGTDRVSALALDGAP